MDPFQSIPVEMRLHIIESMHTREDVAALSLASPAIFQLCQTERASIKRAFVARDLDHGFIDDVMAIISFPRWNLGWEGRRPHIHAHLKKWAAGELSVQPNKVDILLLLKLDALCQYIWLYIDDFLSKSTSRSLPKAHKVMPRIPSKTTTVGFSRRGLIWPWQRRKFDITRLTEREKLRVFRAFLHYEILCKIYGPRREERISFLEKPSPADDKAFWDIPYHDRPLAHWEWDQLFIYKRMKAPEADLELLASVREYLVTLYAGLISRDLPARKPSKVPVRHPEFEYSTATYPSEGYLETHRLIAMMASGGFNLASSLLRLDCRAVNRFLKSLAASMVKDYGRNVRIDVLHPVIELPGWLRGADMRTWNCDGFTSLMRQRAKALFEDDRFCPGVGRLPTFAEYKACCRSQRPCSSGCDERHGTQLVVYGAVNFACFGIKLEPFWN